MRKLYLDVMVNVRTESMSDKNTAVKMSYLTLKYFSLLRRNLYSDFFVVPICMLSEGQVVVNLSVQVLKDLNLFPHLCFQPESSRERMWGA